MSADLRIPDTYELVKKEELPDIHAEGYLLKHIKSCARVALVKCSDENKVFSVAFRTPPEDSTGVAHILEHSVLCGSRNFPVKDPFVELVKGSLNTFLNAMTYPDKTVYPVASCNDADFQNLMHVYLDAVFYPRIYDHEEIFRQEGWNLELESADAPVQINGVVYNEMKGAFSSPEGVLEREIMNSLFPDTPYGVESGGDPDHIPELSYQQFLEFHRKYYHPSNAYIYLYGDMDMEEKLNFLDREYLSHFDFAFVGSYIREQDAFKKMKDVRLPYPVSAEEPLEDNTYLSWQKVIGSTLDVRKMLAMDVLDYALLSANGSPIEKALLGAGIGKDILGSIESDIRQPYFSIVAKNANEADKERFVSIIEETLRETAEKGISKKALLAGINYEEFRAREADYGRFPKGLMYGLAMLSTWLYDEEMPFEELKPLGHYAWLREQVETDYFENLIKECFLDNTFGSVLTLVPERGLSARKEEALAKKMADFKSGLSNEAVEALVRHTKALREYQESEDALEDLEKIPLISRADIRRKVRPFSNTLMENEGSFSLPVLYHDYETSGIAYLQFLFPLDELTEELVPFAGILCGVLGNVDTENYTYDEISHEINLYTGGIDSVLECYNLFGKEKEDEYRAFSKFKGKALYDQVPVLFRMVEEILRKSRFDDEKRLREILEQGISRLQMKFTSSGHTSAVLRASAERGGSSLFKERTEGITLYQIMKDLDEHFEERKEDLTHLLTLLTELIYSREQAFISFTGAKEQIPVIQELSAKWLVENNDAAGKKDRKQLLDEAQVIAEKLLGESQVNIRPHGNEGFTFASKVQFVARTGRFEGRSTGAMHILRTILNYDYLWQNLRVQGGAYGCMSGFSRNGNGYFVSYRDPHLKRTNEIYDGIPEYLEQFSASERDMTKYVIGTVSTLDTPLSPEQKGARSLVGYLTKVPLEELQKERDEIIDATREDIRALAVPVREILSSEHICVIGGEEAIRSEEDMFDRIRPLL